MTTKISALPAVAALDGTELLEIVVAGVTKKVTVSLLTSTMFDKTTGDPALTADGGVLQIAPATDFHSHGLLFNEGLTAHGGPQPIWADPTSATATEKGNFGFLYGGPFDVEAFTLWLAYGADPGFTFDMSPDANTLNIFAKAGQLDPHLVLWAEDATQWFAAGKGLEDLVTTHGSGWIFSQLGGAVHDFFSVQQAVNPTDNTKVARWYLETEADNNDQYILWQVTHDSTVVYESFIGDGEAYVAMRAFAGQTLANPLFKAKGSSGAVLWSVGVTGAQDLVEQATPAAPGANTGRIYTKDVGGKTALFVRFPTGAEQQMAIEP